MEINERAQEIAKAILGESISDQNNLVRDILTIVKSERSTELTNIRNDAENFDKLYQELVSMFDVPLPDEKKREEG